MIDPTKLRPGGAPKTVRQIDDIVHGSVKLIAQYMYFFCVCESAVI